ncbi:T9SS type A sorting domain-containing protein [Flavobacterium sp.]|uniref:T9SS type A sorting domain-containing protein n=1 Tax=Flavobacterium sp. TaxID=239 RepID=UPI0037528DAC
MKKYLIILFLSNALFSQTNLQKTWSTYYLTNRSDVGSSIIDSSGNIIVCGTVSIKEDLSFYTQFTTSGCNQNTPYGGNSEGFIAKFSPLGNLIWSTYFGGESDDGCAKIIIDSNNDIYVSGVTQSFSNISTAGAYMSNVTSMFTSTSFLTKFSSSGNLIWSTYIPGSVFCTKLINGNQIYLAGYTFNPNNGLATIGSYKENADLYNEGVVSNCNGFFMKFDLQGNRIYGTYLGKCTISSFDTDSNNNVYFSGGLIYGNQTNSFTTTNLCHQPNFGGGSSDSFIMKFDSNVTNKIWSTFLGGNAQDNINSILIIDDFIYSYGFTFSSDNISTYGSFQTNITNLNKSDGCLAKFNLDGTRIWGTYFGGTDTDKIGNVVFNSGKLYLFGSTKSLDNIATSGSYQENYSDIYYNSFLLTNSFFAEFNIDGARNWSSYLNGVSIKSLIFSDFNGFYLSGSTANSTGISTPNSLQPNLNIGATTQAGTLPYNMFLSKFEFAPLSTSTFSASALQLVPNPNKGIFSLKGEVVANTNLKLIFYDALGRVAAQKDLDNLSNKLDQTINLESQVAAGVYLVKLFNDDALIQNFKIIIQ